MISFEGPVAPQLFFPLMRTKYVPLPTPVAVSAVAVPPVSKLARSVRPLADPASTTYEVVGPTLALHCRATVDPLTAAVSPFGGAGGPVQGGGGPSTSSGTSFEGGPTP